ncbi:MULTISPECIES: hypothetical protein [unclassified Oleiphilus]|uniref:DUF7352 domain-containing protein n=1 Tax=unclassified Oleiphilus TaxID=2631174 RepID=UPI0007C2D4E6|nr:MULTISPECIES: hypothetical protein [unclassified Oleiphilus]KZY65364.1 hypothetical protein A3738_01315 [Oleiphilus sp. HI0066]KZY67039.1 hypothetical protein A3738_28670 [Oleiphilus sp. HI0066]KZY68415.1 hypothetical protein A3739_01190 [Oleiphilus sp. HI0067]
MKTVHKYLLENEGKDTTLKPKEGFKVLHCQRVLVDKAIYLWVEEPLPAETPSVNETFRIVKSGDPVPVLSQHVATTVDVYAPEAYHVFQVSRQIVSTGNEAQSTIAQEAKAPLYLPLRA